MLQALRAQISANKEMRMGIKRGVQCVLEEFLVDFDTERGGGDGQARALSDCQARRCVGCSEAVRSFGYHHLVDPENFFALP